MLKNIFKPVGISLMLALSAAALTGQAAQAQPAVSQSESSYGIQAGKIADALAAALKSLKLTDAQKQQIQTIAAKYAPQVRAIATNKNFTAAQKKDQWAALRVSVVAEINAILNPAQQAKLKAMQTALKTQITALINRIGAELGLTTDQKNKIQAILKDAHSQASAIVSDSTLSRLQKRQKLQALRISMREAIKVLLTGSQAAELDAIVKQIQTALLPRIFVWRAAGGLGFSLMT